MNSEVSENNSIDMQVPTFVNVVAASCILRCCGVILFELNLSEFVLQQ